MAAISTAATLGIDVVVNLSTVDGSGVCLLAIDLIINVVL